jgi:tetratricopeptide (TPR) repeat protein
MRRILGCFVAAWLSLAVGLAAEFPSRDLERAAELMGRGDLEEAERAAKLALEEPSDRAAASSILGTIRVYQKRFAEAREFLETAIQLNPRLVGARLNLGHVYILEGNAERAREQFREALKVEPANPNARVSLAQLEADAGHYAASLELIQPLAAALRSTPEGLHLLATNYLGLGRKEEAGALVGDWTRQPQVPPQLAFSFSQLLLKHGLHGNAIEVLQKARKDFPDSFEVLVRLADACWFSGDRARAAENYELALQLNPSCSECYLNLGRLAEQQDETEKALAYLIHAKRLDPENPDVLFAFGRVCLKRDLFRDALPALERAVQMRPENDRYLYVLASAYVGKLQFKDAIPLFERLLTRNPQDAVLNYALGSVLYTEGKNYQDAEKYLRASIRLQPDQLGSYYYLGMVVMRTRGEDEAEELFRGVLKRYPDHTPSMEQLSIILVRKRKYEEARELLEKLLRLDPESLTGHYQSSLLLGRLGQKEQAAKHLEISKRLEAEQKQARKTELYLLTPH